MKCKDISIYECEQYPDCFDCPGADNKVDQFAVLKRDRNSIRTVIHDLKTKPPGDFKAYMEAINKIEGIVG